MGRISIEEGICREEGEGELNLQGRIDDSLEWNHPRKGAQIARDKLDDCGTPRFRLTVYGWEDCITVWFPNFEALRPDEFREIQHYVDIEEPYDSEANV